MIECFELFEKKKQYVTCIKDYYTFMNKENLINNGYSLKKATKIDKKGSYKLFEKGKKYTFSGELKTLSGNDIVYVDSKLRVWNWHENRMYIGETFYMVERSKEHLKKINEFLEKYKDLKEHNLQMYNNLKNMIYSENKNERIFSDYFEL